VSAADLNATLPAGWVAQHDTLEGRVILITGAAGGLGRAAAHAVARAGATPILLGRKLRQHRVDAGNAADTRVARTLEKTR